MFHSVLVGYDGSIHSRRALEEAVAIAQADHARLTVMTVVPDRNTLSAVGSIGYAGAALAAAEARLEQSFAHVLDEAIDAIPSDLPVTKLLVHGRAGPALVERARAAGHDLVVVGSRGLGAARALVLGSVSAYVLHHLPGAALVIHAERPAPRSAPAGPAIAAA
jgi:nucleotide-binding universal stress UspA family protein